MKFIICQLRRSGIEIKPELLGDQTHVHGNLCITGKANSQIRQEKVARLHRQDGPVLLSLYDVQIEALKGARMVLRGVERVETRQGSAEYIQAWLCVRPGSRLPTTSR